MRGLRGALVVLVVLAGLAVVVDRAAAWAAQRAVADQVEQELSDYQVDSAPPEVDIAGFPFLTQVVAGEYERVELLLRDVGSGELRLPRVELTATGVTAPVSTLIRGSGPIHAAHMRGEATVGYEEVRTLTGWEELSLAGDGERVTIRLPVELLGQPLTLVGTAEAAIVEHAIEVRVEELTVEGPPGLPDGAQPLVDEIAGQLSVQVPLPPLPYDLRVESVRAERTGLVVTVTARDVPLSR
jgi:hypothetical protein